MKGAEGNVLHHHTSQLYLLHRQTPARVLPLTWNSLEEEKQESHEAGEELHDGRSRLQRGDRATVPEPLSRGGGSTLAFIGQWEQLWMSGEPWQG